MNVEDFSKHSNHNKIDFDNMLPDEDCSCYHCMNYFPIKDVVDWFEDTALCPSCGIDSLVVGAVLPSTLIEAHKYWFNYLITENTLDKLWTQIHSCDSI